MSSENWRWSTGKHLRPTAASISVIEAPDAEAKEERAGQRVPFGFARAVEGRRQPAVEPLTWEGDDS